MTILLSIKSDLSISIFNGFFILSFGDTHGPPYLFVKTKLVDKNTVTIASVATLTFLHI